MAGQIPWSVLLVLNFRDRASALPWSVAAMAVVLWLMWLYLGGKGWPRSTSEKRRRLLRANRVPPKTFALAFLCGVLAIIALAGYWIVFFQLVKTPANVLADASKYPLLTVILVTAMSSLVSPVSEEIAFRGYCQQILESRFSGGAAVTLSSLLFMLAHANHGLYWPKLTVLLFRRNCFRHDGAVDELHPDHVARAHRSRCHVLYPDLASRRCARTGDPRRSR
jgi:membrane protease YdiL (CAAX protease family)